MFKLKYYIELYIQTHNDDIVGISECKVWKFMNENPINYAQTYQIRFSVHINYDGVLLKLTEHCINGDYQRTIDNNCHANTNG